MEEIRSRYLHILKDIKSNELELCAGDRTTVRRSTKMLKGMKSGSPLQKWKRFMELHGLLCDTPLSSLPDWEEYSNELCTFAKSNAEGKLQIQTGMTVEDAVLILPRPTDTSSTHA